MCIEPRARPASAGGSGGARALLPWYVNGSLKTSDRIAVENWLRSSADARRQLQVWQCVAQTSQALISERAASSADDHGAWMSIEQVVSTGKSLTEDSEFVRRASKRSGLVSRAQRVFYWGLGAFALMLFIYESVRRI